MGPVLLAAALLATLLGFVPTTAVAPAGAQEDDVGNTDPIGDAAAGNININNFDRNSVINAYNQIVVPAQGRTPGWTGSVSGCNAGSVSASYLQGALALVNFYREYAADLPPAIFDAGNSQKAQAASLVFKANNLLSHSLTPGMTCYTSNAADGAASSNIGFGYTNLQTISTGYIVDPGSNNKAVGHRRWIINPRVHTMGMGATSNTNALYVVDSRDGQNAPAGTPPVITWPPKGFMVEGLVPARWSISILQDNLDTSACGFTCIDWSNASVSVKVNGSEVSKNVVYTDQFGVIGPTLVFEPNLSAITDGFADRKVDVTVTYADNGQQRSHSWTTTVIDPNYTPPPPQAEPVFAPSSVASANHADGRNLVVVRNGSNAAVVRSQTSAGANNWSAWQSLGGCVTEVDAARDATGKLTVAAIGCGSGSVFVKKQLAANGNSWGAWQSLGGCVEDITIAPNQNGRLTVAGIGCGGQAAFVRTQTTDAGTAWSGWSSLGGCTEQIELTQQANGRLVMAAIGCGTRSVFVKTQSTVNGVGWQPWSSLGGCAEQISLASGPNGKLTVAAIGCGSRAAFERTQNAQNSAGWTSWKNLGGCVRQIDMSAGNNNTLSIAAIGCGGNTAFTRTQNSSSPAVWDGWQNRGGCVQNVTLTQRSANKLTLTGVGCGTHGLFTRNQNSPGSNGYAAWKVLGGTINL